ncbi:hypothetical protein SB18R_13015 [Pseudomonas oryzihabitans]|nr:hypothetical protein NS201_18565 [Pseudomonas psychrotolerans]KTT36967.1 hypothetical protein SB9_03445 [Pseudomonas psychrotolerans]KTT75574.1 hypothetical protein SB18R_13015 [Pseudomonas psychrotolerans]
MAEVVVVGRYRLGALADQQGQGPEGAGFVKVAAVAIRPAFGDQAVALPEEFGSASGDGLGDAAAEGVIAVVGFAAIVQGGLEQTARVL